MRREIDNRCIEYRQPIDFSERPSNMEIGYRWYQNKNKSMWTYDVMDHLLMELETIIALATMTYIVEANSYELHPMDE